MEGIIRVNSKTQSAEVTLTAAQFANEALQYKKSSEVAIAIQALKSGGVYQSGINFYLYFPDMANPLRRTDQNT